MKLIERYLQLVTTHRFDAYKESRFEVRAAKSKDQVQLINIRETVWNTYAREIDDDSFYIGDNGEGMQYLKGLGIDVESEGVKKEVLSILEDDGLILSEKGEIGHVITRDTWNKAENGFLKPFSFLFRALREIEDFGKLYTKYKRVFGNNKEEINETKRSN